MVTEINILKKSPVALQKSSVPGQAPYLVLGQVASHLATSWRES